MTASRFVSTRCLFCKGGRDKVLFPARLFENSLSPGAFSARRSRRREHYRIVACRQCGLVRSDPILSEGEIHALYAESLFRYAQEAPFAARTYAELFSRLVAARLPRLPESLLETGCGNGFFLEQARALGVRDVLGFEPSRQCVEHAPEAIRPSIVPGVYKPELLKGRSFDMACSFHVLDHLAGPLAHLVSLSRHLRPGGSVLLVCHDVESLGARVLGSHNPIFDVEHVYLFSRKTLSLLLESAGFSVLETGQLANRYPLEYWLRLFPMGARLGKLLPEKLKTLPLTLRAGNLYALGQKCNGPC